DPGNIYRRVEWIRNLKVRDFASNIANGQKRALHYFALEAQIPRLTVGRIEIGWACEILAERNKRHRLRELNGDGIPTRNANPRSNQSSCRRNYVCQRTPRWHSALRA